MAASPCGGLVASACRSQEAESSKVLVWDTGAWSQVAALPGHTLTVTQDDDDDDDDDITPSAGLVALQLPAGGIYGRVWVDYKSKTEKMTNQTIAHADITSEVLLDYLQTRGKEQKISKELLNIVAFYEECIKENVL